MSKKIYITPDTNISEEIQPALVKLLKNNPELIEKAIETCRSVKSHLRDSIINSPNFSQHITRTIMCGGKTIVISGSTKKPSWFKRIFG